jgi:hypothetical protein
MAINPQTDVQIASKAALTLPSMVKQPLLDALENLNYLWSHHSPQLVDVCPNPNSTGRDGYILPLIPSADGIEYTFEHRLMPDTTSSVDIVVEYHTDLTLAGAWTPLYNVSPGTTANALLTEVDTGRPIPGDAVALRVEYTAANPLTEEVYPHHLLVYPAPGNPTAGIKAGSGHIPFDDGLLNGAAGAAVHTEFLNRCKTSTLALLRDRWQNCLSFVQLSTGVPLVGVFAQTDMQALPFVRAWFPYQGPDIQITLFVLGDVTAGADTDMIQVRQVGVPDGETKTFHANGEIGTKTMTLHLQGEGAMKYADLEIGAKATAGNWIYPRSVMGFWRPTE